MSASVYRSSVAKNVSCACAKGPGSPQAGKIRQDVSFATTLHYWIIPFHCANDVPDTDFFSWASKNKSAFTTPFRHNETFMGKPCCNL